jgi:hypothetical protein
MKLSQDTDCVMGLTLMKLSQDTDCVMGLTLMKQCLTVLIVSW